MKLENNRKKRDKNTWLIITSIILVCIAAFCLILFLIQGKTTVTDSYKSATETQGRLICESQTTTYPLFTYDSSTSKSMKITAIFKNNDLNSISLIYKLNYDNVEEITQSEASNHASLNLTTQKDGLGPDAYNATYGKLNDGLQLSLYATGGDIDDKALRYFMLENLTSVPYSKDKIAKIYTNQGLKCETDNSN